MIWNDGTLETPVEPLEDEVDTLESRTQTLESRTDSLTTRTDSVVGDRVPDARDDAIEAADQADRDEVREVAERFE